MIFGIDGQDGRDERDINMDADFLEQRNFVIAFNFTGRFSFALNFMGLLRTERFVQNCLQMLFALVIVDNANSLKCQSAFGTSD